MSLLEVTALRVSFPTADGVVQAVHGMSFSVEPGRTLSMVRESGSGKTVLAQSQFGLTPGGRISGTAVVDGVNLFGADARSLQRIRGKDYADQQRSARSPRKTAIVSHAPPTTTLACGAA
jgi:peptide/nickel transport system ATP-binding protein